MDIPGIAQRIKKLLAEAKARDPKHYNFAAIGRRLDVSHETVRSWEKGINVPRLDKFDALAKELGTTDMYLLYGVENETSGSAVRVLVKPEEFEILDSIRHLNPEFKRMAALHIETLAREMAREKAVTATLIKRPKRA